jgi:hypothetical protein
MKILHTTLNAVALAASIFTIEAKSLSDGVGQLEEMFVDDCTADITPHGFYGSFLQPCEFDFFESAVTGGYRQDDACSSEGSTLVAQPTPVHWLFKLAEHIDKDDWDSLSSDDLPDFDELMLWPDQCVAVAPRCYKLGENEGMTDTLSRLFPDGTPVSASHVRVDCRADAMELSRVAYSFASGAEKSMPTIVAWMTTVVLLFLVAISFCCYGCFRLCCCSSARGQANNSYQIVAANAVDEAPFATYSDDDDLKMNKV